jgi:hypothetical protein
MYSLIANPYTPIADGIEVNLGAWGSPGQEETAAGGGEITT